jgi:hypothetical protein
MIFPGLSRIYQTYSGWQDTDLVTKSNVSQTESFTTFHEAVDTLFWCIWSLGDKDATLIIKKTISNNLTHETAQSHHEFTERMGKIMFSGKGPSRIDVNRIWQKFASLPP